MTPFADLLICLRFLSRLPVPTTAREAERGSGGFAAAAAMAPVAGAVLALVPAVIMLAAAAAHLPSIVAAPLAVASLVIVTGALHEDALGDCADGFGGGETRSRKLDIMRDSRIGAFGAAAIALSLYIRSVSLAAAAERGVAFAIAALVLSAALSRAACLAPLILLPPARQEGAGVAGAPTDAAPLIVAAAFAVVIAALAVAVASVVSVVLAVLVAAVMALATCALAWRQIGGQTGDVAGAAQQMAEIGVLLVFAGAR